MGHTPAAIPARDAIAAGQRSIEHLGSSLGGFVLDASSREPELRRELLQKMDEARAAGSVPITVAPACFELGDAGAGGARGAARESGLAEIVRETPQGLFPRRVGDVGPFERRHREEAKVPAPVTICDGASSIARVEHEAGPAAAGLDVARDLIGVGDAVTAVERRDDRRPVSIRPISTAGPSLVGSSLAPRRIAERSRSDRTATPRQAPAIHPSEPARSPAPSPWTHGRPVARWSPWATPAMTATQPRKSFTI